MTIPTAAEPQHTLKVTYPFAVGHECSITPTPNLKSDDGSTPAVIRDRAYTCAVRDACFADINLSGGVDIDVLVAVITSWGTCPQCRKLTDSRTLGTMIACHQLGKEAQINMRTFIIHILAVIAVTLAFSLASSAQVPDYDFQWTTVTDTNNLAYGGGPQGQLAGRGSVPYQYRISRLELTSAQFLEFVNTFWESEGIIMPAWFIGSSGIVPDLQGPYVLNGNLPNAGMIPVIGLNWRVSAMYCNWLHNGKSSDLASLQNGAYDVSTFHTNPDGSFTDQLTRSPGAKFWIPSLDEWIKAAHYDPDRYGDGQGGWWLSPNGTDLPLIAGPPGIGQTSGAGTYDWQSPPAYIPLGSYPEVQSPWGLWDVSGGAQEWTEEPILAKTGPYGRMIDGSWAGAEWRFAYFDQAWGTDWSQPQTIGYSGLRIASAVPGPGSGIVLAIATGIQMRKRRRTC